MIASPEASDAAVISASSEVGGFPASNLFRPQPFDVWRASGCAAEYVVLDFGAAATVQLVWLGYTNATSAATWRVRAAETEADLTADPPLDTGSMAHWPSPWLSAWERTHAFLWIEQPCAFRWWRIDIADAANPAGYYEAGRLYLARAWQPSRGADFGDALRFVDASQKERSRGGNTFVDQHGAYREVELTISYLTREEMYERAFPIDLARGASRDVLVIPDVSLPDRYMDQAIYGTMRELAPIQNLVLDYYQRRYRVEEWELP